MNRNEFESIYNQYADSIGAALGGFMPEADMPQKKLLEAMRYSLLAPGKRLRGIILLEFYRMCAGKPDPCGTGCAMPFACAIEMIHCYSLIHDDLPCMDNDDMRRGKPSNHKVFGEATALLAGSALLSRAFEIMLEQQHGLPAANILQAAHILACASGLNGIAGGQQLDMDRYPDINEVNARKTGSLFAAAASAGCAVAGAPVSQCEKASDFGYILGSAFQAADDYSDGGGEACLSEAQSQYRAAAERLLTFPDSAFLVRLTQYLSDSLAKKR